MVKGGSCNGIRKACIILLVLEITEKQLNIIQFSFYAIDIHNLLALYFSMYLFVFKWFQIRNLFIYTKTEYGALYFSQK